MPVTVSQQGDVFEKYKIRLTRNFFLYYSLFSALFTLYLFAGKMYYGSAVYLFNTLSLGICALLAMRPEKIKESSILFFFTSFIGTTLYMLVTPGEISVLNGMWYILLNMFVYLNLGRKWYMACFFLIILAFNPIAVLKFNGYVLWTSPQDYNNVHYYLSILIALVVAFIFMNYIIKTFIDKRKEMEHRLLESNRRQEILNMELAEREKELKENHLYLSALLKAIPDRMFYQKSDGTFLGFKASAGQLFVNPDELKGRRLEDLPVPADVREGILDTIRKAIDTGELQTSVHELPGPDGTYYYESRMIRSGDDEVVSIVRDVTEKHKAEKELEENRKFMERVLSTSPSVIWIRDNDTGKIIFANKEMTDLLGYTLEDFNHDNPVRQVMHPDDLERFLAFNERKVNNLADGEIAELEYRLYDKQGNIHWMLARFTAFSRTPEGKLKCVLGTAQDITHRKHTEQQLVEAKEKAEQAAVIKSQFLSTMSHEIRTPLNAVIGFTYMLMKENPREDQVESLRSLEFSSRHLLSLIDDILDFSRIEAGKVSFEEVEFCLEECVENVRNIFQLKAKERNIDLQVDIPATPVGKIKGEPTRLNQVLANFISNAIKFTEKGYVKVSYRVLQETENDYRLSFSIKDTGIGIAADKLHAIFESFTQGDSSISRRFGGAGLGLAICKRLVEMQGGSVSVESHLNQGSTFTFILPVRKCRAKEKDVSVRQLVNMDLTGMNILLAEDNPMNIKLARKFLNSLNTQLDVAEDGKIAIEKASQKEYDVILMDLQMPEYSGYEATEKIRAGESEYLKKVPIIALTANTSADTKAEVFNKGMNGYISKPFNPDELYNTLKKYMPKAV